MDPFAKFESKFKGNLKSIADPFAKFESQFNIKRGASNQRVVGGLENLNQDQLSSLGITSPVSKPTLNNVLGATSPYLTPGYKPGTQSAKYSGNPARMQDLSIPINVTEAIDEAIRQSPPGQILQKGSNTIQGGGMAANSIYNLLQGRQITPEYTNRQNQLLDSGIFSRKLLAGKSNPLEFAKETAGIGSEIASYVVPLGIEGKVASMGLKAALPSLLKGGLLQGGLAVGSNALRDNYAGMSAGDRTKAIATDFAVSAAVVPAFYGTGKLFTKVSSLGSAANAGKNSAFFDSLIGTTSSKEANAILKNQGLVFDKSISNDVAKSLSAATTK